MQSKSTIHCDILGENMDVYLTSDLHYGFNNETKRIMKSFLLNLAKKESLEEYRKNAVLIIAGDLISSKKIEMDSILKIVRDFIKVPILVVLGNHDLWDTVKGGENWYEDRIDYYKQLFKQHDIHYLQGNPLILNDIHFVGFDGWYHQQPRSNDTYWMPKTIHGRCTNEYLASKANDYMYDVIDTKKDGKKLVLTTHFNLFNDGPYWEHMNGNTNALKPLTHKADYLLMGHSHKYLRTWINDCLVMNCGSDYNEPAYAKFSIN